MKSCCLGNLGFALEERLERCFDSVGDESRRDEKLVIVGVAVPLEEASGRRWAGYGTRSSQPSRGERDTTIHERKPLRENGAAIVYLNRSRSQSQRTQIEVHSAQESCAEHMEMEISR
jgi:hypothetical protein